MALSFCALPYCRFPTINAAESAVAAAPEYDIPMQLDVSAGGVGDGAGPSTGITVGIELGTSLGASLWPDTAQIATAKRKIEYANETFMVSL